MKKGTTLLILTTILFCCKTVKQDELYKDSGQEKAILNIIYDFSKTEKNKKGKYYEIIEVEDNNGFYRFLISNRNKTSIDTFKIINTKSKHYPSKYKEINNRLYIWADSTVAISQEIINIMDKYNAIDSTIYKIEKNLLPESEWPVLINAENIKVLSYYVCKKDVSIYGKNWGTHKLPASDKVIKQCNEVK